MAGGRGGRRRRSCRGTLSVLTPTRQPPEGRACVRGCVDGLWTGSDLGLLALSPLFLASGSCLVRRTAWCTSGTFRRRRWCRSCRATRVSLGRGLLRRSGRWCRDGGMALRCLASGSASRPSALQHLREEWPGSGFVRAPSWPGPVLASVSLATRRLPSLAVHVAVHGSHVQSGTGRGGRL